MICIQSAHTTESDFTIIKGKRYGFNDELFYSMKNKIWMLSQENTPATATTFAENGDNYRIHIKRPVNISMRLLNYKWSLLEMFLRLKLIWPM